MDEYTIPMILLCFGFVMVLVTLAYVIHRAFARQAGEVGGWQLRGASHRIAAVARTTLAEGLRAKVASGFAAMILVSIPIFWLTAEGDGTIKGQIQMFVAYSLGFAGFVMALLTIFFSCRSLSKEIASRQIYGIVSKPIPRWQIVAGKWCGVMFLNVVLLTLVCVATYLGTHATVERFKEDLSHDLATYGGLTPTQAAEAMAALDRTTGIGKEGLESPIIAVLAQSLGQSREQVAEMLLRLPEEDRVNLRRFDELRRQVLVSRATVSPAIPDFSGDIEQWYRALEEQGNLPENWTVGQIREKMESYLVGQYSAVPPGGIRQWRLKGPKPEKGRRFIMSVRFKINAMAQLLAAQFMGVTLEENTIYCAWGIGDPRKPNFYSIEASYPVGTFNEFEIPAECVEPDGTVLVNFRNLDPRNADAVFDFPNGLQILYRVGSFEKNLFQAWLATLIPLACLASFGVCASTFLSFPVGSLIVITLFVISSSIGFVAESFAVTKEYINPDVSPGLWFEVRRLTVDAIGAALSIGDCDPVREVIEGRSIGWPVILKNAGKHVLLKSAVVMFIAVLVLRRRELAAVVV